MKIVIAPDKFKGTLSSIEFCNIVSEIIHTSFPNIEIHKTPLADGGDGTSEVLSYYLDTDVIKIKVTDPLFRKIDANYLLSKDKQTAFIEMSKASGLYLLKENEHNPLITTSYGTGELIKDALEKDVKLILLGIGGSATNDGGIGMARALGFQFYDKENNLLQGIGSDLVKLDRLGLEKMHPKLKSTNFKVLSDINAPLFGNNGAAYMYAHQKGAGKETIKQLDVGLRNFNEVIKRTFEKDISLLPGSGAAGGLGAGASIFLNASLRSGIEVIKEISNFAHKVNGADWIITGEGKFDNQTLQGKVIKGIIDEITNQKLAVFCGRNEMSLIELQNNSIVYIDDILSHSTSLADGMKNTKEYLKLITRNFLKSLKTDSRY